ncbi:phosphoserine transaminase [Saccharothrix syringae]|uniref:phosphoserine transaminase n=1 Tax=Saccharothrix syringae TaxID=103733 RepID=A0A5Q0H6L7_SACSY|nr:phosphoserine transaminase [Saccharothrix syringae]QFZ21362.1 phosphoserine transaminase [Saccharothrix syringae]
MRTEKPTLKPARPWFSSGPCAKRPGWDPDALREAFVGRSHRDPAGRARLFEVIERSKQVLGLPADYRVAIVPGSDTGAIEMAMWNLLGYTGVEVCCWENFGFTWLHDISDQLRLDDVTVHRAERYGAFPDVSRVDFDRDVVFTWNGTTSGVRVPGAGWIPDDRRGLTICDATSAVLGMEIDYRKLDVITWSWQKALGGEGAHGMIALSPAAVERLAAFRPDRPLPKVFRLVRDGRLIDELFEGFTINSPSMLAVEDALDALRWCADIGGGAELVARTHRNFTAVEQWVRAHPHLEFLAERKETISPTSICLKFDDGLLDGIRAPRWEFVKSLCRKVEDNGAGYDLSAHREAPPGLRIWGGPTVDTADIEKLLPWIDWALSETLTEFT